MKKRSMSLLFFPFLVMGVTFATACTSYDPPPRVVCFNPAAGASFEQGGSILIRFSEPIVESTLDIDLMARATEEAGESGEKGRKIPFALTAVAREAFASIEEVCGIPRKIDSEEAPADHTYRLDPPDDLTMGAIYDIVIHKGLRDLAGNETGIDYTSFFIVTPPTEETEAQTGGKGEVEGSDDTGTTPETGETASQTEAETSAPTDGEGVEFDDTLFLTFTEVADPFNISFQFYYDFKVDQETHTFRGKGTDADPIPPATNDSRDPGEWEADESVVFFFQGRYRVSGDTIIGESDPTDVEIHDPEVTIVDAKLIFTLGVREDGRQIMTGTLTSTSVQVGNLPPVPGVTGSISGIEVLEDEVPDDLVRVE